MSGHDLEPPCLDASACRRLTDLEARHEERLQRFEVFLTLFKIFGVVQDCASLDQPWVGAVRQSLGGRCHERNGVDKRRMCR